MTTLAATDFVKPVPGHDDLVQFVFDFGIAPEGKAVTAVNIDQDSVTELEDGDLLIEGWAADFEGVDRQGENFVPGAFQRGIDAFLGNSGALCYHHDRSKGIGKVLELDEVEGKGLHLKARVSKQEPTSPLRYIYDGVKKGDVRGLSVGGFFKRQMTPAGYRISDVDFTEVSVTPVPVHPKTAFSVIAGKALINDEDEDTSPEVRETDREAIRWAMESLNSIFESIAKRGTST